MAQSTGSVTTSNGNVRSVRLTRELSGGTVTNKVEIYSKFALSWSGSTLWWRGAGSGSQPVSYYGTGVWITVKTWTNSISPGETQTLIVTWSQPAVSNTPATAPSTSVTISRPYNPPAPPSGLTATRNSDSQGTLTWTNHATSSAPYSQIQVARQVDGGGYATIATLDGGATSYTVTGTSPGHRYDHQVRAVGPGGTSRWHRVGYASDYSTTPVAPTGSTATKQADNSIVTTAAAYPGFYWGISYDVGRLSGGATTPTVLATGLPSMSHTDTSPNPSQTHAYVWRARYVESGAPSPDPTLVGPWSSPSATVQLQAPPNPPSSLSPNGAVFDATEARTFSWQHNPVDTTAQTAFEVHYRESGASTWTSLGQITSSSTQHDFPADTFTNGSSWEWQVRTWGADEDPSDWSPTATFTTSAAPTATIQSPEMGSTLTGATCTLVWVFYDEDGTAQSQWRAELIRDGVTLETRSGTGTASAVTFTTRLDNAATYTARVQVRDGSGLWSAWDVTTFTTDFAEPATPVVSLSWDEDRGAVVVSIENTNAAGLVADTAHNTVERSLDGGQTWVVVAEGVAVDGSVSDATVPLGVDALYRAVAWSDLPSSATGEAAGITTPATSGFWAAGGVTVRIMQRVGEAPIIDSVRGLATRVLHRFAGRTFPVETAGTARSRTASVAFSVSAEDMPLVEQLAYSPAPHLIRAPDGQVIWASISDVDTPRMAALDWWNVGFTATEIEP